MQVKKTDLPTEGVKIQNIHFLPDKAVTVSKELGDALLKKGFVEVSENKMTESKEHKEHNKQVQVKKDKEAVDNG